MSRPLDDVVVIDLTRLFCASLGATFLAVFGARVLRLELLPLAPGKGGGGEGAWNHEADLIHRNKESLALDVQCEQGRALLHALVAKADVVLTDWSVPELEALGIDYAAASVLRPDIVFGRLSGFGPLGPDRDLPPIDELAAARTGMMPILPQPGQPPVYTGGCPGWGRMGIMPVRAAASSSIGGSSLSGPSGPKPDRRTKTMSGRSTLAAG